MMRISVINDQGDTIEILSDQNIRMYKWQEHRIFVDPNYIETLHAVPISDNNSFIISYRTEIILEGVFIDASLSSFDISKPVIYVGDQRLMLDLRDFSFRVYDYENTSHYPVIVNKRLENHLKRKNIFSK